MEKEIYKVSVIIPVYNVRDFISHCAESLMNQTLDDIDYIFVDDSSPDDSIDVLIRVLEKFPYRKNNVRIVKHNVNQGLPAARNTGLAYAKGEYIFHCDGDDFVEPEMLKDMYTKAKEVNADIVWSDWYLSFENKDRYMSQPCYKDPDEALKALLSGAMKYNVWNKLVKRTLYIDNNIKFPTGHGMGEDMTMIRFFMCANKIAYIPKAYYHYVKINTGAMTNVWSQKHIDDLKYNVEKTENYIRRKYYDKMDDYISFFKLNVKVHFLISDNVRMYSQWNSLFAEAHPYIMKNKLISMRIRILQWMAWKKQYWFILLYYRFVQQFIINYLLGYR